MVQGEIQEKFGIQEEKEEMQSKRAIGVRERLGILRAGDRNKDVGRGSDGEDTMKIRWRE